MSRPAIPLPILALALAAFAIGTTEFVIMGILPTVAADIHVTLPTAGLLVTGYALGVAGGAPLLAALTARWPHKAALLVLMLLFIAGNLLSALAPDYNVLMAGRVVASLAHGSFFGIGAVVAAELVPPQRRASAIALMFTGLTLATVLGVPLGTLVGQQWGWRATFYAVAGSGVLALAAVAIWVPHVPAQTAAHAASPWRVVARPRVLLSLLLTVFGFGGIFVAYTFITPLLSTLTGLASSTITAVLFLFGLGLTVGNTLGGKLADRRLLPSLTALLLVLAAVEALLPTALHSPVPAVIAVFFWGVAAFALVPGLQMLVVRQTEEAAVLASTLNIAAFNLGNAGGAWLGAHLLEQNFALATLPVAAALTALVAFALTLLIALLGRRATAAPVCQGA